MAYAQLTPADKCGRMSLITTVLYEELGEFRRDIEGRDMYYSLAPTHPLSASLSIHKF